MRSSRLASPLAPTTDDDRPSTGSVPLPPKPTGLEWVEPHLRPPAPSFRDYSVHSYGNSSTKDMKPLGYKPTQADKAKYFDVDKRDQRKGGRKGAETREATPGALRDPDQGVSEPRISALPSINGRDVDGDYIPTIPPRIALTKVKDQLPPKVFTAEDPKGPEKLRGVIESVLKRATERNTLELGRAVERVWQDSFQDPSIVELIDAVLTQRPTAEQTAEFQRRVKVARGQIKDAEESLKRSSTVKDSTAKSSPHSINGDRASVKRRLETADESLDALGSNINGASANPAMQQHSKNMNINGTPSRRSAKRAKRSNSTSSLTSSLSSISSSEQDLPATITIPPPSCISSSDKQHSGPRLHSFPLNNHLKSSNKRSFSSPARSAEDTPEEAAAKRRKLQQTFDLTVNDSEVRQPVTQQAMAELPQTNRLPSRSKFSRFRNGATPNGVDDDFGAESSLSPPPMNGELLAPPFADEQTATRGTTPTRLGRPPKHVRKGARIKMS